MLQYQFSLLYIMTMNISFEPPAQPDKGLFWDHTMLKPSGLRIKKKGESHD